MSILSGASNFVITNSQFVNQAPDGSKGAGLKELRETSILGASHDSSERYPPPMCHPGTRQDYIERLTQWGLNVHNHTERMTWLKGPAGVGKSAIAQSCAEALGDKLGASIFFSRPNHRDDPDRFFTSIAYQLTEKFPSYGTLLDDEIRRRPTLVKKSLPYQFHDLFITPFTDPTIKGEVAERVIIVDGLDECARTEAQVDIIKIVAESIRAGTTPFLWIFLSRLEPKIAATFDLPDIEPLSQQIDLPVTREIDQEILLYLTDKLREVGCEHHLTLPWPSEEEVWALVDFSAGLFACAHAIIQFVCADSPAGPVEHLHAVLRLAGNSATKGRGQPLSALDELYTLVMERVSPTMLLTAQWILSTTRVHGVDFAYESANLLGLSELQFRNACRCLHPVMKIESNDKPLITFYHASFMDFIEDPSRSGRFCIWSDCAVKLLEEILQRLDKIRLDFDTGKGGRVPRLNLSWPHDQVHRWNFYYTHLDAIFKLSRSIHLNDDTRRLHALVDFDFRKFTFHQSGNSYYFAIGKEALMQNLNAQLKLIRPCVFKNWWGSLFGSSFTYFTIGHGEKRALLKINKYDMTLIQVYSTRLFKNWVKQLYEGPEQSKDGWSS